MQVSHGDLPLAVSCSHMCHPKMSPSAATSTRRATSVPLTFSELAARFLDRRNLHELQSAPFEPATDNRRQHEQARPQCSMQIDAHRRHVCRSMGVSCCRCRVRLDSASDSTFTAELSFERCWITRAPQLSASGTDGEWFALQVGASAARRFP